MGASRNSVLKAVQAGILAAASLTMAVTMSFAKPPREVKVTRFEISFPSSLHSQPITGRVFVIISRKSDPEPLIQMGSWEDPPPIFGVDVNQLKPGNSAIIDGTTPGYPVKALRDLPAGDYFVQALVNVYTEFHRSDGHVIWAHMDHWEGQQLNRSPGNLYSGTEPLHLDPASGFDFKISLSKQIPPVQMPPDTEWVKHFRLQSELLTKFWGRPMYLGATVLLPKGYADHPEAHYPVIYYQDHFSLKPPMFFTTEKPAANSEPSFADLGYDLYQAWISDHFPRMIVVSFQHPTPFFDDSYAVNSANDGPYGDAIMQELIPYVEEHFRIIRKPYARVLFGGSTGGWESLALQVFHPDFYGGTWTGFPDPIDFRRYQLTDIYDDDNAFYEPDHEWLQAPRYMMRTSYGQPEITTADFSRYEAVLGSHGRSGQQFEAWEAVYGPVGSDGYPKPLWDKRTGAIDHSVAEYMRDHNFDLRYYLQTNWPRIGPALVGKIHLFVGDMDNFYLNLAVYLMEDFLKNTTDPYYGGSVEYGRPMKGHGWLPVGLPQLVRTMADQVSKDAPAGENTGQWKY